MTRLPSSKSVSKISALERHVSEISLSELKGVVEKYGVTESNLFLSALLFTLNRYTREDTVSVLTVSSGRDGVRLSDTVGMFVKTLPVVSTVNSSARVTALFHARQ